MTRKKWPSENSRCRTRVRLFSAALLPPSMPPVRAEVDLGAVVANARDIKALVGPTRGVLAVLKADAYGHGLLPVAKALQQDGTVAAVVVSTVNDALSLRSHDIELPIIALACEFGHKHGTLIDAGITPVLASQTDLDKFARAARRRGVRVAAHVELDTGMSRSGLRGRRRRALFASGR